MSIVSVRAALEAALDAITPSMATAWENAKFSPVTGTPYQRVYLLPAEPDNVTMGDAHYQEMGILQVNLMYPLLVGSSVAAARAELVRSTFKRGNTFTSGGVRVVIEKTPEVGAGTVDGDRWLVPVKVRYFAFI